MNGLEMSEIATKGQFDEAALTLGCRQYESRMRSFWLQIQYVLAKLAFNRARTFLSSSCSLLPVQKPVGPLMKCATIRCYMHGLPYLVYKGRHLHPSR